MLVVRRNKSNDVVISFHDEVNGENTVLWEINFFFAGWDREKDIGSKKIALRDLKNILTVSQCKVHIIEKKHW